MSIVGNEPELIVNAQAVLGPEEPVLHAGVFEPQDSMNRTLNGQANGALVGGVAGAVVGGLLAHKAATAKEHVTSKVIVAVTDAHIHIVNWGDTPDPGRVAQTFDRSNTKVSIKHLGFARRLKLTDNETGTHLLLQGSAGRMISQSGPDQSVLDALAAAS